MLILDEPTAALGVNQSGLVLRFVAQAACKQNVGVIFIKQNPHHAFLVGDPFVVLVRGEVEPDATRESLTNLMSHTASGAGLQALKHELRGAPPPAAS